MPDLDRLLKQHVDDNTPGEAPDFGVVLERARRGDGRHGEIAGSRATPRGRRVLLVAAAAAAVAVGGWGATGLLADGGDDAPVAQPPVVDPTPTQGPSEPAPSDDPVTEPEEPSAEDPSAEEPEESPVEEPVERSGPLQEAGEASCVFEPTEENLAQRAFAFDGTVAAIDESTAVIDDGDDLGYAQVTFDVNEWYAGGEDPQVVIQMTPPVELTTDVTAEGGPSYEVGTRLLVSGEPLWGGDDPLADPVGWGCGFTVYWDADTAQVWEGVFGG